MLNWVLLKRDCYTTTELWKTQTQYLVCQKYERKFKFKKNLKEATDFYFNIINGKRGFE
ncbi:MAG: hypothetical protein IKK93_01080 [Campylobacter sp.]|nr:hypothetical protein [Campylobacter sp.]